MKKALLLASSNGFLSKSKATATRWLLTLAVLMTFATQQADAQCLVPYQNFESIPGTAAGFAAEGWTVGGSGTMFAPLTANVRSGRVALTKTATTAGAFFDSPVITNLAAFTFYVRGAGTAVFLANNRWSVEISDDNGATWTLLTDGVNNLTLTHNTFSCTTVLSPLTANYSVQRSILPTTPLTAFPVSPQGYKFRFTDTRLAGENGGIYFDDFAWRSSVASENTTIVPELASTALCNYIIQPGTAYYFYDHGGKSDTYSNVQNHAASFTPAVAGFKIKATYEQFNTQSVNDYLQMFNSNDATTAQVGANMSLTSVTIGSSYTASNPTGELSFRFVSDATLNGISNFGYRIRIEAVQCNTPNTLTAAGTFEQVNLGWTGSASATQYEVFQATSAAPVPTAVSVGTLTGSTATTYSATGLTAGQPYFFWVRSVCGADKSDWAGPISATPICNPTTVPYLENFNGFVGGVLPPCTRADSPGWQTNATNGNLFTNTQYSNFYTRGVSLTAGTQYRVTYDFSTRLLGTGNVEIYWGSTNVAPTDGTITNPLAEHFDFAALQSNIVNFTPLTTGTYYLRFFVTDITNSDSVNFDNIRIEVETCAPPLVDNNYPGPTNVSLAPFLTAVDDFTANIGWGISATGLPSNGYDYIISTSLVAPIFGASPSGSAPSNSTTLTSLSPNTRYYVWIRGNCGAQISPWSQNYITFVTTNETAPTTVLISNVEPTPASGSTLALHNGCNFTFLDSGAATSNYVNFEEHTYTFRPVTPGTKLKVVFNSFATENNYDGLMIYSGDGSSGNSLQLMSSGRAAGTDPVTCPAGAYSGTASPGTIISNATNGSLSFTFRSDFIVTGAGWSANISCVLVPTVTSFSPLNNSCATLPVGSTITINGTNLSAVTSVTIGGVPAGPVTIVNSGQITVPYPAGARTGKVRVVTADAFGISIADFVVQNPAPVTTAATVCIGGTGTVSSSTVCDGFINPVTSISVNLNAATDLQAPRPASSTNSTACNFVAGSNRNYVATEFQVSVTGSYVLEMSGAGDGMAYIAIAPFTAGVCSGNFVIGDDDSGAGLNPQLTVTLTAGVTYVLYSTTFGGAGTVTTAVTWAITPPVGGSVLLYQNSQTQWYDSAVGGVLLHTGATYDPVGDAGSGVVNNTTPITRTYYAACSSNATCRTATTYTIVNTIPGTASSNQTICSGSAADLTLTGNGAPVTRWQYNATDITFATGVTVNIPASASTTLTSAQIGTFSGTRYYRAEVTVGSCTSYSNVITITFNRTVWNGGWSNGLPDATKAVEFQSNYTSTGDLSACSVTVSGGNIVIATGHTLTIQNELNVSGGTLTFQDDASLYQPNPVTNAPGVFSGGNTGTITYNRTATPMFKFDYTYWSSPVHPQNLLAVSPLSPVGLFFTYSGTNWQFVTSPGTTTMNVGRGYLIRAPSNYPVSPGTPQEYTAPFSGTPNNGTIPITIVGGALELNLIGNPYPSAISAFPTSVATPETGLITANPNLNGSLYFWTHNTPITGGNYTDNDYAIYNLTGGSAAAPNVGSGNNSVPTGFIAAGQGFFAEGLASGTVNFTNAMRRPGNNTQFFRTTEEAQSVEQGLEKHRYWLDISNNQSKFKQALIGYIELATNDIDRLFDAKLFDNGVLSLYTKVGNTKLSIQGKDVDFDINEQIPLAYSTNSAGQFTINLSEYDGLFVDQVIYLEDKLLNIIHNLKESSYTFTTAVGTFEDRFVLRYTNSTLSNNEPIFNDNTVVVYKNEQGLFINSGIVPMNNVMIYDVRGRLIASQSSINATNASFNALPNTNQVLLVKITSTDGVSLTKKVVY
ncbi:MAG: T9SS sorting signal type C domain-containing protein [Flavobacterium sp.]|uniref:T9SS sorting signal type C domain-containing protein n=1 Tax=Flavobacterium sp. TaxID=239 RepID=UPI0022BE7B95|nr:T9SS sorting signal type C domain-containing protein [Flavobacterium sp.]MCZ8331820.1 T9SS sorting signal type C domain-containing protein [Flavobacterium sp.]